MNTPSVAGHLVGSIVLLASMSCSGASAPKTTAAPAELVSLIPTNAVAVALAPSLEELSATLAEVAALIGTEAAARVSPEAMLSEAGPFDASLIASSRAVGFALGLDPTDPNSLTRVWILPSDDPAALGRSLEENSGSSQRELRVLESYVAVALGPRYVTEGERSALTLDMQANLLRVRVDVEGLMRAYGPMVQMGLAAARQMYAAMSPEGAPMDMGALMGVYIDGVDALLTASRVLELNLTRAGARVELAAELGVAEDSAVAGLWSRRPVRFEEVSGCVAPDAIGSMHAAIDVAHLERPWMELTMALFAAYPEEAATSMRAYMEAYMKVVAQLGTAWSMDFGFGAGGVQLAYYFHADDAEEAMQAMAQVLEEHRDAVATTGLRVGESSSATIAGVDVLRFDFGFDAERMNPATSGVDEEQLASLIEAVHGDSMALTFGTRDGRIAMTIGADDDFLRRSFERLQRNDEEPSDEVLVALELLQEASPSFALRVNLAQIMRLGMRLFQPGVSLTTSAPPLPLTTYAGVYASSLKGGLLIDLDEFAAFGQALHEREVEANELPARIVRLLASIEDSESALAAASELDSMLDQLSDFLGDPGADKPDMKAVMESLARVRDRFAEEGALQEALEQVFDRLESVVSAKGASVAPFVYSVF